MFSKQIFISVALVVLVGGTAIYLISKRNKGAQKPTEIVITTTPTPTPLNQLTWTDEAGFSFKYPEGTDIDKHPDDTKNYANLTLTLPSKEIINIVMSDNTYKNLDSWAGDNSTLDTTLDGQPAKKILKDGVETIACIDNEVMVTIRGKNTAEIVKSWKFIYPMPTAAAKATNPANNDGGDVLEEE